mmetsp:Transcript_39828/g.95838  ORF Transcript_39828/g.95838 Transcript_39828/m.95838 type:complete len:526 (-) Transcript_39828:586-2163(-)
MYPVTLFRGRGRCVVAAPATLMSLGGIDVLGRTSMLLFQRHGFNAHALAGSRALGGISRGGTVPLPRSAVGIMDQVRRARRGGGGGLMLLQLLLVILLVILLALLLVLPLHTVQDHHRGRIRLVFRVVVGTVGAGLIALGRGGNGGSFTAVWNLLVKCPSGSCSGGGTRTLPVFLDARLLALSSARGCLRELRPARSSQAVGLISALALGGREEAREARVGRIRALRRSRRRVCHHHRRTLLSACSQYDIVVVLGGRGEHGWRLRCHEGVAVAEEGTTCLHQVGVALLYVDPAGVDAVGGRFQEPGWGCRRARVVPPLIARGRVVLDVVIAIAIAIDGVVVNARAARDVQHGAGGSPVEAPHVDHRVGRIVYPQPAQLRGDVGRIAVLGLDLQTTAAFRQPLFQSALVMTMAATTVVLGGLGDDAQLLCCFVAVPYRRGLEAHIVQVHDLIYLSVYLLGDDGLLLVCLVPAPRRVMMMAMVVAIPVMRMYMFSRERCVIMPTAPSHCRGVAVHQLGQMMAHGGRL